MNLETSIYMKIILTENDIKQIVKESVRKILKENDNILNNITPEQVLEIINNATNNDDFEVWDGNLECTTPFSGRRPWVIEFEGKLPIRFYRDVDAMVLVKVNVEAWINAEDNYSIFDEDITGVEIMNIESVEFYVGETFTTINMGNMLNQVNEILNSDIVNKKLVSYVCGMAEYILPEKEEEYEDY